MRGTPGSKERPRPPSARKNDVLGPKTAVINFRDVAEHSDGRIASGRVFRSANPHTANRDDARRIVDELRVRTVLDLRSLSEEEGFEPSSALTARMVRTHAASRVYPGAPAPAANIGDATCCEREPGLSCRDPRTAVHVRMPLLDRRKGVSRLFLLLPRHIKAYAVLCCCLIGRAGIARLLYSHALRPLGLLGLYAAILDENGELVARVLREVVVSLRAGAVLLHCSAGKDRTGLIAMMLLSVAGAAREQIVTDYERTEEWHSELSDAVRHSFGADADQRLEGARAPRPSPAHARLPAHRHPRVHGPLCCCAVRAPQSWAMRSCARPATRCARCSRTWTRRTARCRHTCAGSALRTRSRTSSPPCLAGRPRTRRPRAQHDSSCIIIGAADEPDDDVALAGRRRSPGSVS